MALLVGELKSVLGLDTSKYDQGLDRSHAKFTNFVKSAAVASAAAAVAAGAGLLGLAKGAAEDDKAQTVLARTLKNTAKATDAQVASIEDYISKTGVATGVTDDEMRPALANLVRATKDVGKAQSLMGLAMDISAGTGKDLGAVTMALAKAQNGSVGGLAKLGIATKDASGKTLTFDQIQKNLAKTFKGQAADAAETTAGKWDRLKLIMSEAGETVGYKVLPVLLTLGTFLLDKVVPAVGSFASGVESKLMPVLQQARDFFSDDIVPALKVFVDFVHDTLIPLVGDIVSGFAGLGKKVVQAIGPIDLAGIASGIFDDTKAWASAVISGLKTGIDTGDWKPLGRSVGDGVIRAIRTLGTESAAILDEVGGLIDRIDWGALGGKVSSGITGALHSVDWKALGDAVGDGLTTALEKTKDLGVKLTDAVKTFVQGVDWQKIGHDSTDAIGRFFAGVDWNQLGSKAVRFMLTGLKVNLYQIPNLISGTLADVALGIWASLNAAMTKGEINLHNWFKKVGGNLISGLWSGITGALKGAEKWLENNLVLPISNWVRKGFGIHSPSTVFIQIGTQLVTGLLGGILAGAAGIGRWIYTNVINPVVAPFGKAGSWLVQHGRNAVAGFKAGASTAASGIGRWIYGKVISPLVAPFSKAGSWLNSPGRNVIAGFKNGMAEIWGSVTKWVSGIATWIKDHKGPVSLDGTLLVPAGRAIMSGFLTGLKSGAGPAWSFVQKVGGKTVEQLRSALSFVEGAVGAVPNATGMAKLVQGIANSFSGWGSGYQWDALYHLIMGESGFRSNAQNPTSTAYGLFQFLDSTWGTVGAHKTSDPTQQTIAGLKYIQRVYGTPAQAWAAWSSRSPHWYAKGTPWIPDDQLAYVHKGEMVVPADVAEFLRKPLRSRGIARFRSKLHELHELHQAHAAHLNHLNHAGRGQTPSGVGADLTSNGVTSSRWHPDDIRALAVAFAGAMTTSPLQLNIDSRKFDAAMSRTAFGGGY